MLFLSKSTPYREMKKLDNRFLEEIPEHWTVLRLGKFAKVLPSNVDKKSVDGQLTVQLCNYTDVYNNEFITQDFPFMKATATDSQINKLSLRENDIIITKDSETPLDIAVPAYVPNSLLGVVCGYHLAMIRPYRNLAIGEYIFRAFQSESIAHQYRSTANGITRFGLTVRALKNAVFPLPPLNEQEIIKNLLFQKCDLIDDVIKKKNTLIKLLHEKRQALITHAVTKGLDPTVPMKDSGVEELGDIPLHWDVKKIRYWLDFLNHKRIPLSAQVRADLDKIYPYYGASGIIDYVDDYIFEENLILIAEDGANLYSRSTPLAFIAKGKYWVNNHAHILKPKSGDLEYWAYLLESRNYDPYITGSAQPKLSRKRLSQIKFTAPKIDEQRKISVYLNEKSQKIDSTISKLSKQINLIKEYRQTLITNVVKGTIDVRGET